MLAKLYSAMTTPFSIAAYDAVLALAFIGDLSMGRPTDHSARTGRLAIHIVTAAGGTLEECDIVRYVSLLRWSGCTANAAGFNQLLGDDVVGREALLSLTLPTNNRMLQGILPLVAIHCEVSGDIAHMMQMGAQVESGLRHIFENYNGQGMPGRLQHPHVPETVYFVSLASDLEILSRAHGLDAALAYINSQADAKYPASLVKLVHQFAAEWLAGLDAGTVSEETAANLLSHQVPLTLVGDVIDLKLPWMAGYSRQVAELARASAALLGLDTINQAQLCRAGLLHGLGRAALPNNLWDTPGKLHESDWERIRLMPYWTSRATRQIPGIAVEADLASYVYERQNGSGYFRSLRGDALSPAHRILATAAAWCALRARRPWRDSYSQIEASAVLRQDASNGLFDLTVVDAILAAAAGNSACLPVKSAVSLSERETDVLRRISQGDSNKQAAQALAISPSTVRTHIESILRKLECTTRAAATLKAYTLGLL